VRGLGETVEKQMVGSLKSVNMKGTEPPSTEKRLHTQSLKQWMKLKPVSMSR
jgi:hypothetical protein